MRRVVGVWLLAVQLVLSSATAQAQQSLHGPDARAPRPPAKDLVPDPLPLTPDSPLDDLYYADRVFIPQQEPAAADGGPFMQTGFLTGGALGTGTGFPETFQYQLPVGYSPSGTPHPMVIAYHGYGASAASVAAQSTIDEEANARDWIYMAPTGLDDQLFGSPISQRNTAAAIQWMILTYNVDPDRLYMVGFSMGGGVVANFAARNRNPDGLMIAAVGMVAGAWDWTMSYHLGSPALQSILANSFNFGGSPFTATYAYQRSSCLYFDPTSYPPTSSALLVSERSMARNLHATPLWAVRDLGDTSEIGAVQGPVLQSYIIGEGGSISDQITAIPDGMPISHSWSILDEPALFDFFEGKVVDRYPQDVRLLADGSGTTSYLDLTQRSTTTFSSLTAQADDVAGSITIDDVVNAAELEVDVGLAGIEGVWPVRVTATSADADGFTLRLTGFDATPCYLLDATAGTLVTLVDSDPATGSLVVEVDGFTTLDVHVVSEPDWTTALWTTPSPALIGQPLALEIDGPAEVGASIALTIVSAVELLTPIKGGTSRITAGLVPPSFILDLPLDLDGDVTVMGSIPDDPEFQGIRLVVQAIVIDTMAQLVSISNLWGLRIE